MRVITKTTGFLLLFASFGLLQIFAEPTDVLLASIDKKIDTILPAIIEIRHNIHQHPELGTQEVRTSKLVADRLRSLGLEVQTGLDRTGVVAVLRGGKPGPVVAFRSELDALPVTEPVGLSYASKETATLNGQTVGVMHACGHDIHIAVLLGVAEALSSVKKDLSGTVKFIFQPAEEGVPPGEEGGASSLVKAGVLENPRPDVIYFLHSGTDRSGRISISLDRTTAGIDPFVVKVKGKQTHAAMSWRGVDPIPVTAQIILAWQTIPSRQSNLTELPAPIISIGKINAGQANNIIPGEVVLEGGIRTQTEDQRKDVIKRFKLIATSIAQGFGAEADIQFSNSSVPPGHNNLELTKKAIPVLEKVSSDHKVRISTDVTYAGDDFAVYSGIIPGVQFGLGVIPESVPADKIAPNHSPLFVADDNAISVGIKAFTHLFVDYSEHPVTPTR